MTNDFLPTASIEVLRQRAEILRGIRKFFDDRHFFEVETPLLSHDIVVDQHLHPISIPKCDATGSRVEADQKLWLQTSPEFGMKRIVASGAGSIYQICKCFRQSETGDRHNPEFTMLEWYRVGDNMQMGMELLGDLIRKILSKPKVQLLSYRDAFLQHANIDPFDCAVSDLSDVARQAGISVELRQDEHHRDAWLNLILAQLVEPQLGVGCPTIVYDWPATQAALAVIRHDDPPVAERFELFVEGVELANGYHELLDPDELAERNSINNQKRLKDGSRLLPEDSRLLEAMKHGLPACAGVALGIDRLVMLALEASSIRDVIAFPIERA